MSLMEVFPLNWKALIPENMFCTSFCFFHKCDISRELMEAPGRRFFQLILKNDVGIASSDELTLKQLPKIQNVRNFMSCKFNIPRLHDARLV